MIENQSVNYKLCFSSEERLFSLIVDLNNTVLVAFVTDLVRLSLLHLKKQNQENRTIRRNNNVLFPG